MFTLFALCLLLLATTAACGDGAKTKPPVNATSRCVSDSECEHGRCDPLVGCVGCLFDRDCGPRALCASGECHERVVCATDDDCDGKICDVSHEYCGECASNRDCKAAQTCAHGFCAATTCTSDDDCADGQACKNNRCVPHCSSNDDCPVVYYCDDGLCALDRCEAGQASCSSSGRAILQCSDSGDSFGLSPCGVKQSCVEESERVDCRKWTCAPGKWSCDATAQVAQLCASDGLELVQEKDCAAQSQVCEEGGCVERVCDAGVARCTDGGVALCNGAGSQEDVTACKKGSHCDADSAECVPNTCEPGSNGCLAETIAKCKDDGSGLEASGDDCAEAKQSCWEGACHDVLCNGDYSCFNGNSYSCNDNRTSFTLSEICSFDAGKLCSAETGRCEDWVCKPGLPTCNEDLATSCSDDGSHPLDVGVDCTEKGQVCWNAQCLPPICKPDSYICEDSQLKRCINKGTAYVLANDCGEGTVCDAEAGTCRLQKCLPDRPACDGNVATTCDATGLSYTGARQDCASSNDVCVAGECTPVICEPEQVYCDAAELRSCGPNGGTFKLLDTCSEIEYCDAANKVCAPDVCAADAPLCVQSMLTQCKPDGSGPLPGGTDCSKTGQACDRGACRDLVCAPAARFCDPSGDVVLCNAAGTDWAPYDNCRAVEFCDASKPNAAWCAPDLCPQSGNGCQGEHLAQCNAEGSGFSSVGKDCGITSQVCDLSGSCLASAVDDFGADGAALPSSGSAIHFALFRMFTSRTLTQLSAAVSSLSGNVTWVVYHSNSELGTYKLVDQKTSAGVISAGYVSSAPLSISLQADGYYLLGIAIMGAHAVDVVEGKAPSPVSFGQMLGGFTYVAGATPTIQDQLQMTDGLLGDDVALRVTSGPP